MPLDMVELPKHIPFDQIEYGSVIYNSDHVIVKKGIYENSSVALKFHRNFDRMKREISILRVRKFWEMKMKMTYPGVTSPHGGAILRQLCRWRR